MEYMIKKVRPIQLDSFKITIVKCVLGMRIGPFSRFKISSHIREGWLRTVKAPNFPPHGNFPYILARSIALLGDFSHKKKRKKRTFSETFIFFNFL